MSTQNQTDEKRNGRNPLVLASGAILLVAAAAVLFLGGTLFGNGAAGNSAVLEQVPKFDIQAKSAPVESSGPLAVGDVARDFTLSDLDGNSYTLSELRGRPVIVNFWATWCAPCRVEMPELQAAFEQYQDQGLLILALDQAEPPEVVRDFFYDEMGLTFTPLLDEQGSTAELYSVFNFPSSFFINPEGTITAIHRGLMVREQLDGYLAQTIPNL
ncbi:MAG: TlpA family protein disulfide reductase [Anaerolineae bacterium]